MRHVHLRLFHVSRSINVTKPASVINTVGHYVEKGKATFEAVLLARPRGMDLGYNTT